MPYGIWMHGDDHTAVEDIDLEDVAMLPPELADVVEKPEAPKTAQSFPGIHSGDRWCSCQFHGRYDIEAR
jgi:hypothetical protein